MASKRHFPYKDLPEGPIWRSGMFEPNVPDVNVWVTTGEIDEKPKSLSESVVHALWRYVCEGNEDRCDGRLVVVQNDGKGVETNVIICFHSAVLDVR